MQIVWNESHDYHVFIQTLISLTYYDLSLKAIWYALIKIIIFLEIYVTTSGKHNTLKDLKRISLR